MMSKHLGVQYAYSDAVQPAPPAKQARLPLEAINAALSTLPSDLNAQLIEGIELGDLEMIDTAIAQIFHHDNALAETLSQRAQRFEFDELLRMLKETI
jgi:hypothetical protein